MGFEKLVMYMFFNSYDMSKSNTLARTCARPIFQDSKFSHFNPSTTSIKYIERIKMQSYHVSENVGARTRHHGNPGTHERKSAISKERDDYHHQVCTSTEQLHYQWTERANNTGDALAIRDIF